jgi:hypothetical protein
LNVNSALRAHGRQGQEISSDRIADDGSSFNIDGFMLHSKTEDSGNSNEKVVDLSGYVFWK